MARIRLFNYTFAPGGAGAGTVKIPGNVRLDDILLITNTTNQTVIYNFADPARGGTVSFSGTDTTFGPDGATTLTLEVSTSGQLSTDKLQIYLDVNESAMKPAETFMDPVQKMRVSTPQSLIDTDFEYGTQPSKWEFLGLNGNTPSYFIRTSDSPITVLAAGAGTLFVPTSITAAGTTTITVNTANTTGLVAGTSQVYIFSTTAAAANGVFTVTGVTAGTSFTYTATATVGAGTISQTATRVGTTTINGNAAFIRTSTDISPTNLNVTVGTPINIQETANEALADGSFLVQTVDQTAKIFSYVAKGTLTATSAFNTAFTTAYIGKFFGENVIGAGFPLAPTTNVTTAGGVVANGTTTITVNTVGPHNLNVGSQIFVSGTNNDNANGSFSVVTVPSSTQFTYTALATVGAAVISTGPNASFPLGTQVYARPDANLFHRAQDGGVQITTSEAVTGQQAIRQTRRQFRYQSGKGIQFSTACQFKPTFDMVSLTASGTTATVTTEVDHGVKPGAQIRIEGVTVASGTDTYTGTWTVATVPTTKTLTFTMGGTPTDTAPRTTEKMTVVSWYGARVRTGLFDEQNGFFFEFDGQRLFAVRRNSIVQLKGTLSVCTGYTRVVGTNTQFNKELRIGDYIVIKGMSYQVTRVTSATDMDISPAYRSPTPSTATGALGIQLASTNGITTNATTTVTVNTRTAHGLTVGQRVFIWNTSDARCNGGYTVATVPSATSFTYTTALAAAGTATISNVATFTGTLAAGSDQITSVSSFAGLQNGQTLTNANLATGTIITNITGGGISTVTLTSGGAGYRNNRTFTNVALRNVTATGVGARATITTNNSGVISSVTITTAGTSYAVNGTVTVAAADVGGTGGGALFTISAVTAGTITISPAATGTAAGTTISVECARIFAEERIVRYTKTIDTRVPTSQWSIDKVDGTGPTGYTLNLNKIQMIYLDYQWYGAGYIRFGMRAKDGEIYYCHKFLHNNFFTEAYMRSGNVPARFEVNTVAPTTYLTADLTNVATTLSCNDTTDFPTAGRIRIENELIDYTGKTANSLTGLTRGVAGGSAAAAHTGTLAGANGQCTVQLTTCQLSPSLSHWGVAVIMDGRFDNDTSYVFVTPKQTASLVRPTGSAVPLLSIRVAPSVDSGVARPFGVRYILNRMQLTLRNMGIFTNAPLLVTVRLNCSSPLFRSDYWLTDAVGNGSLSQVIYHNTSDLVLGGDQVSAFYVQASDLNSFAVTTQDISTVKDLGTSILSGDGVFPDGPEVLTVFVQNLGKSVTATTAAAPVVGQFTVTVTDATDIRVGQTVTSAVAGVAINAIVTGVVTTGTTATISLSKPNTATTAGAIVFEDLGTVYGRLSWTEAQA